MVNAIIAQTQLGRSADNLPFVILAFNYQNNEGKMTSIVTKPVFLVDPSTETLNSSNAINLIFSVLDTVGVAEWESLIGKVVRLEIKDGSVVAFANAIESKHIQLISSEELESETTETTETTKKEDSENIEEE